MLVVLSFVEKNLIGITTVVKVMRYVKNTHVIVVRTAAGAILVNVIVIDQNTAVGNGAINALIHFQNGTVHQVHLGLVHQVSHRIGRV